MRLGLVEIERLHQRRDNPRRMSEDEYAALQRSVERFGFSTFIVVVEDAPGSFGVVDGHHRWKLARETGMKRVPVVVLKDDGAYTDLAMLTFNVGGSPDEAVFVDFLAELTRSLGAMEVAGFTALDAGFLDDLQKTAAAAYADMGVTSDGGSSPNDMATGSGWQGKPLVIEVPNTPETHALLAQVIDITKHEVLGQAVLFALKEYVDARQDERGESGEADKVDGAR